MGQKMLELKEKPGSARNSITGSGKSMWKGRETDGKGTRKQPARLDPGNKRQMWQL